MRFRQPAPGIGFKRPFFPKRIHETKMKDNDSLIISIKINENKGYRRFLSLNIADKIKDEIIWITTHQATKRLM